MYPEIRFEGCRNLDIYAGRGTANLRFDNCSLSRIVKDASPFTGRFGFMNTEFVPEVDETLKQIYDLDAELGVSFSDCTVYMPEQAGQKMPEWLSKIGFFELNNRVRFNHSNTRLGNDIIQYCNSKSIKINPQFVGMLKSHHELEGENI